MSVPSITDRFRQEQLLSLAKCIQCPLAVGGCADKNKLAFWRGPQGAEIAVVGESPTKDEARVKKIFRGRSAQLLEAIFKHPNVAVDPKSIYYTTSLLCHYPGDSKPNKESLGSCNERLLTELASLPNLKVVIPVGGLALYALTGQKAVTKEMYNVFWNARINAFVIPTYNPAFCYHQPEAFDDIVWAIQAAKHFLTAPKGPQGIAPQPINVRIARSRGEAIRFLRQIADTNTPTWTAIDWEADHVDPYTAPSLALGFAQRTDESLVIPWVPDAPQRPDLEWDLAPTLEMIDLLEKIARNPNVKTVFHNGNYDIKLMVQRTGVRFRLDYDTMLSDYSLDERGGSDELEGTGGQTKIGTHRLKASAKRYLFAPDWEQDIKQYLKSKESRYSLIPRERLYQYLAYDVHYTLRLREKHEAELLAEEPSREGFWTPHDALHKILIPGMNELITMELEGILINRNAASQVEEKLESQLADLTALIKGRLTDLGYTEEEVAKFNIRSNDNLQDLIYKKMGVQVTPELRTKLNGGKIDTEFPTGKDTLTRLRDRDPVIAHILDFKALDKQRSTYVTAVIDNSARDGRIHAEFPLTVVKTGRLASRGPNIQNIMLATKVFYEPENRPPCVFVNADYKQLEVRVAAVRSRDPKLIKACNGDIHGTISREIFAPIYADVDNATSIAQLRVLGIKYTLVAPMIMKIDKMNPPVETLEGYAVQLRDELRNAAKPVIFGVIYGREAYSLAVGPLQCKPNEAQKYIDNLFSEFSGLAKWLDKQKKEVELYGWIESRTGRRRRFPFITDDIINRILKQTVNAPIQGEASDICFMSFIRLAPKLRELQLGSCKLLVHDAIGMSIHADRIDEGLLLAKDIMENTVTDKEVKFEVDFKVGPNYGKCDKYKLKVA